MEEKTLLTLYTSKLTSKSFCFW